MPASFSEFASSAKAETAFTVLAAAKRLMAAGKDVIELEIGDSPFATPDSVIEAGVQAIREGHTHYGPSNGLLEFRQAASRYVNREYGWSTTAKNIVVGPGAKNFEQLFCEAFLDPGDGVLIFSPHFPTYPANVARRGGRISYSNLEQARSFRPNLEDVERFLAEDQRPKGIFLNSPHNPTGGVALPEDLRQLADLVRGRNVAVFCDEPYDRMVWTGQHQSLLGQPEMYEQVVAAYTFSKSFSMSGWRLGFAVSSERIARMLAKLTNTSLSCVPPFTQLAGVAAMQHALAARDQQMQQFRHKVERLVSSLQQVPGITCLMPGGTFYAFPSVKEICNRLSLTSHGLAMYLLEGADERRGVACLGGECFGAAGSGFLRLSCAEPDQRLSEAVDFIREAIERPKRVSAYLDGNPPFRLATPYSQD